jgi:hypothetical protein
VVVPMELPAEELPAEDPEAVRQAQSQPVAVPAQIPNGMGCCLSMDLDRAFQTIDSGSVLAKFRSFRTGRLYTLSQPKTPPLLDAETKTPLGSAEQSLGTDPKGAAYLSRPSGSVGNDNYEPLSFRPRRSEG